ncbi:MAG: DUF3842 family protein [Bacillota bacterium]|nr:DUF3842 family protein [Bacillota bacterium]
MAFRIAVVDGQGAGIGKNIISKLKKSLPGTVEIIALGTNATATAAMLKAGASQGATGENAIIQTVKDVDLIIGCLGIVLAHSMLGELTPRMAEAIAASRARKLLIPVNRCGVDIVGMRQAPLPEMVDLLVQEAITAVRGQG